MSLFKKPTILQIFFAKGYPTLLWYILCVLVGIWEFINSFTYPQLQGIFSSAFLGPSFVLLAILAGIVGFFAGAILGIFVIRPLYLLMSKINGAPFHDDDIVRIITGPHKGKTVRVYAVWNDRMELRVWLDEKESKDVTDVFSYLNVYKLPSCLKMTPKRFSRLAILSVVFSLFFPVGLILAVISVVMIRKKKDKLRGLDLATLAIILNVTFLLVILMMIILD